MISMHTKFFKLAGVTCPKCKTTSTIKVSYTSGTYTAACAICDVIGVAPTYEDALHGAVQTWVTTIDPNLKDHRLHQVVKSIVRSLVEVPVDQEDES